MTFDFTQANYTAAALGVTPLLQVTKLGTTNNSTQHGQLKALTEVQKAVFVAGAGTVGLTTALALLKQGFTVVLHDPTQLPELSSQERDLKLFAVNYTNVQFFKDLGAWKAISALRANPYNTLSLYADGQPETVFTATEVNLDYLGYMIENTALVQGLLQTCQSYPNFIFLQHTQVISAQKINLQEETFSVANNYKIASKDIAWQLTFSNGLELITSVVLAADGANSFWRTQAKIGVDTHSYPTKCMLIQVETNPETTEKFAHHTWQFVDTNGPKAWLPESANAGVLCWYDQIRTIDSLQKLTPEQLKQRILDTFPLDRIGTDFTIIKAASFPLARRRAQHYWQANVLLLGDAAHTVSPLAGQGLNLGLLDAQCLSRVFADNTFTTIESRAMAYARERYLDNTIMQEFLSFLHHSYISKSPFAQDIRNMIYRVCAITPLKHYALNYANGDRKLLRGVTDIINSLSTIFNTTPKA